MARPEIPDVEKERIEEIYERHRDYPPKSFQEALSTVADLAEEAMQEPALDEKLPFQYEIEDSGSGIEILLTPEPDSNITRTDAKLETPNAVVKSEEITDELNQIEGVDTSVVRGTDGIKVILERHPERSFDEIVDEIFTTLSTLIQHHENKIEQIEQRAEQYTFRKDSTNQ